MSDQCGPCILRGDLKVCEAEDCSHHETWYAGQLQTLLTTETARLDEAIRLVAKKTGMVFSRDWLDELIAERGDDE